jgi:hypothetical protein
VPGFTFTHDLQRSRAGGLLAGPKLPRRPAGCGPAHGQPRLAQRVGHALWAVTAPRANTAARLAAAHRWPRWEEMASTSKRGPGSMRRARRVGWVSPRWRGTVEVVEQRRRHSGFPAAMMPPYGQRRRGRVPGDQRERERERERERAR